MNGKTMLYVDQYGEKVIAHTVKELVRRCGGGKVSKIYRDGENGEAVHVGYCVGRRWFNGYLLTPMNEVTQ